MFLLEILFDSFMQNGDFWKEFSKNDTDVIFQSAAKHGDAFLRYFDITIQDVELFHGGHFQLDSSNENMHIIILSDLAIAKHLDENRRQEFLRRCDACIQVWMLLNIKEIKAWPWEEPRRQLQLRQPATGTLRKAWKRLKKNFFKCAR